MVEASDSKKTEGFAEGAQEEKAAAAENAERNKAAATVNQAFVDALNSLDVKEIKTAINNIIELRKSQKLQEISVKEVINTRISTSANATGLYPIETVVGGNSAKDGVNEAVAYLLAEGAVVKGRNITYSPDLKTDVSQAIFTEGSHDNFVKRAVESNQSNQPMPGVEKAKHDKYVEKSRAVSPRHVVGTTKKFTIDLASFPRTQKNYKLSEILHSKEREERGGTGQER